jgi:hypothetical protein
MGIAGELALCTSLCARGSYGDILMSITLANLENTILMMLQQPPYDFANGSPDWGTATNPQYPRELVDYVVNMAYRRIAGDLKDYNLMTAVFTLSSSLNVGSYPIPPLQTTNPFPEIAMVRDVFYLPLGQTQTLRYEPGQSMVSWTEFMRLTGQSFLRANSGSAWPTICAIGPQRNTLELYPQPVQNGDTITVYYNPLPTPNAVQCPTLVSESDVLGLPSDCEMALIYFALAILFRRNSDDDNSKQYRGLYLEEIKRLKTVYQRDSIGDSMQMTDIPTYPALIGAPWLL